MRAPDDLPVVLTKHAERRWVERFPQLSLMAEWRSSRKATRSQRRQIKRQLNYSRWKVARRDRYVYFVSPSMVVFCTEAPWQPKTRKRWIVITVFPLGDRGHLS